MSDNPYQKNAEEQARMNFPTVIRKAQYEHIKVLENSKKSKTTNVDGQVHLNYDTIKFTPSKTNVTQEFTFNIKDIKSIKNPKILGKATARVLIYMLRGDQRKYKFKGIEGIKDFVFVLEQ